jgi:hypothetical protein
MSSRALAFARSTGRGSCGSAAAQTRQARISRNSLSSAAML